MMHSVEGQGHAILSAMSVFDGFLYHELPFLGPIQTARIAGAVAQEALQLLE
jgi:hypothetical protein